MTSGQAEASSSKVTLQQCRLMEVYSIRSVVETPSAPPFQLSRASKDVIFGSLAGMVAKVFEHPFDLVKVRLQTQSSDRPAMYTGALDCFRQTYVKEGIKGLYRGLSMPIFGATLENASLFFTYNYVQGKLRGINGVAPSTSSSSIEADAERPLSMPQLSIAAACAGAVTSFVLTPIELIKCKMQVQMVAREMEALSETSKQIKSTISPTKSSRPSGMLSTARPLSTKAFAGLDGPVKLSLETIQREGPGGLWLGQTGTLLRETGGGIAWFLGFEWACRTMIERKRKRIGGTITKKDLSSIQLIGAGALAGVSYNVILFPADSVKSTMQTDRELSGAKPNADGSAWKKSGFISTFNKIYKTKGIRGLYAGCAVTCMRSAPSSALIFLMYNKLEALADDYGI